MALILSANTPTEGASSQKALHPGAASYDRSSSAKKRYFASPCSSHKSNQNCIRRHHSRARTEQFRPPYLFKVKDTPWLKPYVWQNWLRAPFQASAVTLSTAIPKCRWVQAPPFTAVTKSAPWLVPSIPDCCLKASIFSQTSATAASSNSGGSWARPRSSGEVLALLLLLSPLLPKYSAN